MFKDEPPPRPTSAMSDAFQAATADAYRDLNMLAFSTLLVLAAPKPTKTGDLSVVVSNAFVQNNNKKGALNASLYLLQ